ncbi:BTB domain and ankyrin repeat containing protein [Metarhizium album ARSEF 1941]|uniref:BTB domain and ankyrin repeat containing protein n=1 Tax=Metarhizium album (strain ARSEF 1941) TaxID=1081103 RepID=A0A0B2WZG9_METAS|nr:BTB domain and ankyrin repeat containing protein [Metarhizium album ARSEF 1941]KHO01687.1 BTB domain and ankyrin repeat containing protein [Metarhizium album ARSEF 1941]
MSHLLWKFYWENDVDRFRRLLAPAAPNTYAATKSPGMGNAGGGLLGASPGGPSSSPRMTPKLRRTSGCTYGHGKFKDGGSTLNRQEINSRDHAGLTVLLRAASSTHPNARDFVQALLEHPSLDLYAQDSESGWNALHRSLYAGNISIARMLLARERADLTNHTNISSVAKVGQLIKTKDHEGNSPFDVYNSTIAIRSLKHDSISPKSGKDLDDEDSDGETAQMAASVALGIAQPIMGDEFYTFGSNKNLSLGVGDEDDRQYPERIVLQRPEELLYKFHKQHLVSQDVGSPPTHPDQNEIPTLVYHQRSAIRDVVMSKLHSAVLTDDPVSNLYICGVGRGGRLGLGDENTQFKFVPVQGPFIDRKVRQVALGQNHSMAVTEAGELWTWGLNSDSQLGYTLPPAMRSDEEPMSVSPRQVFGPLKKEMVQGVAASAIHSVAHTGSSLYCWGRNFGQLALMDADSRLLELQQTPRKVAASLLSAPIEMVSAIDKATTCLLSNYTVWIFTNYGYNLVKFPYPDVFSNQNLSARSYTHRYEVGRRNIRYIASGGETIAAVTSYGDLFTMQLNSKTDTAQLAGSTTNPVKIKSAVTQPQCVWDSRKDGVASVSVGEHGSVIICTESGAVWKRVKRAKGKVAAFASPLDAKKKDFKFERVPYITNCVGVRSSTFGAFAAIRNDSKIMSTDISIANQSIWEDVGSLLWLSDFRASTSGIDEHSSRKKWNAAITREQPGSVPHEILSSINIEQDLLQWVQRNSSQYDDLNMEIRTSSSPDLRLPVHSWLLAGRSSSLREALSEYQSNGNTNNLSDIIVIEQKDKALLTFIDIDIYTLLNLIVYVYLDVVIPVWKYTKEAPSLAFRFRQVRTELMKLGTRLNLPKLETAARLQTRSEPCLDENMREALLDPTFFNDADMLIELDGGEVLAHSHLVCQRCLFFGGMFHGRSQGHWLTARRNTSLGTELVRVDLKHISPETFRYVMKYLYADIGSDLFNDVCVKTLDEFSEVVLDVMGVANELMLDRLSQICQSLMGKFVTTRNVANLLNEISPCSVTKFKDVGLEYICLQLESMLENHLLDNLDEDLLLNLDEVVRNNQLARFPFVRSGRADMLLHQRYPDLALDIEEERRRRVREMAFKIARKDEEKKLSSSYKASVGSLDESVLAAQTPERSCRRPRDGRNEPFSPRLRPKDSLTDLIFDMDGEDSPKITRPTSPAVSAFRDARNEFDFDHIPKLSEAWRGAKSKSLADAETGNSQCSSRIPLSQLPEPSIEPVCRAGSSPQPTSLPVRSADDPWASPILPASKLDFKDIMQEATSKSALTAGLASQTDKATSSNKPLARMSQKERKRQQVQQAEVEAAADKEKNKSEPWQAVHSTARPTPWKMTLSAPRTSLRDAMQSESAQRGGSALSQKPLLSPGSNAQLSKRRAASPDTRFPGQGRTVSSPASPTTSSCQSSGEKPLVPHSKSYIKPAAKSGPTLGTSMADIIGQQRLEQQRVKEAVAKRPLQEIQEEQAFQEWWDQESRRAQEEEARRQARGKEKDQSGGNRRGRRGRGGKSNLNEDPGGSEKTGDVSLGPSGGRGGKARRGKHGQGPTSVRLG